MPAPLPHLSSHEEDSLVTQARTNLARLKAGTFDHEEEQRERLKELHARFPRPAPEFLRSVQVPTPPWKLGFAARHGIEGMGHSIFEGNAGGFSEFPEGISFSSDPDANFDYEEPVNFGKDMAERISHDDDDDDDDVDHTPTLHGQNHYDYYENESVFDEHISMNDPVMRIAGSMSIEEEQQQQSPEQYKAANAKEIKRLQEEKGRLSNLICDLMDLADNDGTAAGRLKELKSQRKAIDVRLASLTNNTTTPQLSSSLIQCNSLQQIDEEAVDGSSSLAPDFSIHDHVIRTPVSASITTLHDSGGKVIPVTPLRSMNIQSEPEDVQQSEWSSFNFEWSKRVNSALSVVFKLTSFRRNQLEAINAVLSGRDVFVLMPTGGGKSLCYQLPAVVSSGITLVVSPLLSLIQDQLNNLHAKGIPALTVSSGLTEKQRRETFAELHRPHPECKLFYITPEMLMKSQAFQGILQQLVSRNMVARFIIDEAHCLSQWGHDFRPDYKELRLLKSSYPKIPIMALTATANSRVKTDIIQNLGIADCVRLAQSFNRHNLRYYVVRKTKSVDLDIVSFINSHYHGKSGIIYCLSKKDCELMAHNLQVKYRINAKYYHATLNTKDRSQVQKDWAENRVQVIVATIAFGMGIDKPDVRFVIHHSIPKSLEGYYQETGRAGRDGLDSTCVLYYSYGDKSTHDFLIDRGEGSHQQKQQQRDNLRQVIQFCENRIDCRRQMVLQYFGETFDSRQCNKTCDNCENRADVSLVDRSKDAKAVLALLNSLGPRERITLVQLIDVFRGSGSKKYAKFAQSPHYGSGRDLTRTEAERLLQNMAAQNVLQQFNVTSVAGYVSTYIRAGQDAREVESGIKKVMLVVDNSLSPEIHTKNEPSSATQQSLSTTRNRTLSKRKNNGKQLESVPDLIVYSDPLFDPAEEQEQSANKKTRQKGKKKVNSREESAYKNENSNSQAVDCYNAVLKKREEICVRDKVSISHIMDNKTIREISMALPTSLTELARVRGIDDNKLVRYGPEIIDVVKKFK